jgi:catechol 2,3-dioxygenase-like lactoylglutathione lyase family enzyme
VAALTWLGVPGDEQAWIALGFTVDDGAVYIGRVRCSFTEEPAWGFDEIHCEPANLGVETLVRQAGAGAVHPCGVTHIDHIVYTARDLDTAIESLNAALGIEPRRRFHPRGPQGPEMAFYRVGEAFIEVVATGQDPALIGLALRSPDLDATVAAIRSAGGPVSDPKPAVQGGRIASVWAGYLNWGLAVMGQ